MSGILGPQKARDRTTSPKAAMPGARVGASPTHSSAVAALT